jgi:hypothetical protein
VLVGCGAEPAHRYICDTRRNCAGAEVEHRGMRYATEASTTSEAEVEIVDECETDPCTGALNCWAFCQPD